MADYPVFSSSDDAPKADPAGAAPETLKAASPITYATPAGKDSAPMPDMYERIADDSSFLGRLASKIPGFSGYMERGRRREADQIIRETLAARLEEVRLKLSNVHQDLSGDIIKAIDHAEPLGRAESRLMGLINKIRSAPQGYAGFFDAIKIKEEELARIYEFDANMMNHVDKIAAEVDVLQVAVANDGDIKGSIRALDAAVQEASTIFNSRQELLSGVA
jgi:hypothetical protein